MNSIRTMIKRCRKQLVSLPLALLLVMLILPATPLLPAAGDGPVEVYFRLLGPADQPAYPETGEYELIWAGMITVPESVAITCTSGEEYQLYVDDSNRYIVKRTGDGATWDRGPADKALGATSVLAALDEASRPENGNFTYEVSDAHFPAMGFYVNSIDGKPGSGAVGWNYRVWNPVYAAMCSISTDSFLLGYSGMPVDLPHDQLTWYWGGTGHVYPLRVSLDKDTAGVGESFTATVEYFRDEGWSGTGSWETLPDTTLSINGEEFTTGAGGKATLFLEREEAFSLNAEKPFDGSNYYIPSDNRTKINISGGDTSDWWVQTSQGHFNNGSGTNIDTVSNPGDVTLERGGIIAEDYILDSGSATLGGEHFYDEFRIINGAVLYVVEGQPLIIHASYIEIDAASQINADGKGYPGGSGTVNDGEDGIGLGAGSGGIHSGVHGGGGAGASYASSGGKGSYGWTGNEAEPGYTYGGTCRSGDHTFFLGSGGGGGGGDGGVYQGGNGGRGGGAVRLEATTVNIYGTVTAQGAAGSDGTAAGCGGGGGGSGGTIYIACGTANITSGAFWISGGSGGSGGGTNGHGAGGGSGGHIKVFYETANDSTGHHAGYSAYGIGDPYNGRPGGMGAGVSKTWWYQEPFLPVLPYYSSGEFTSDAFDTSGGVDFQKIRWSATVPDGTGLKFQIATNNDNSTWSFLGPDGTSGTYYTATGVDIWTGHSGDRYIRYRAFFDTSGPGQTATLSKVGISFSPATAEVISFSVNDYNDDGIKFGFLQPGMDTRPADGQPAVGTVALTVGSETNVAVDIQIKGSGLSGPGTIGVENIKYNSEDNFNDAIVLTDSYVTWYSVPAHTANVTSVYFWIDVPEGQPPGDYASAFYFQAVKSQ